MDEMQLKIKSDLAKKVISNKISKEIKKVLGVENHIYINDIDVKLDKGNVYLHLDLEGICKWDELLQNKLL